MTSFDFNPTATRYEPANAYALGRAAKLAYSGAAAAQARAAEWGLGKKFHFFDHQETQGFLAANDQMAVLAFRGTEPTKLKDWMSDADLALVDFPGGKAHKGFVRALGQVWPDVLAKLAELRGGGQTLWITGHSLGAALAALASARLRLELAQPVAGLYTFGQPRVGNGALAKALDADLKPRYFRFVNNNDVVPRVPPPGLLLKYSHAGTLLYFDEKGGLQADMPWWKKLLDGAKGRTDDLLKPGTAGINDHSMDRYVELLQKNIGVRPAL